MIKQVKPQQAQEWLNNGEACIIDVRELSKHKAQSIKGSSLIPSGEFCAEKIPSQFHNKKIVIHCQRGGRASRACQKLMDENPKFDVYNLEGGILSWAESGLETACTSDVTTMSIERQVRLTAGSLVFLSCILAILVDPIFIIIPTFVGFGLAFTAIIDWCCMSKLLAMMPWNK